MILAQDMKGLRGTNCEALLVVEFLRVLQPLKMLEEGRIFLLTQELVKVSLLVSNLLKFLHDTERFVVKKLRVEKSQHSITSCEELEVGVIDGSLLENIGSFGQSHNVVFIKRKHKPLVILMI